jgi:hypothetical protein
VCVEVFMGETGDWVFVSLDGRADEAARLQGERALADRRLREDRVNWVAPSMESGDGKVAMFLWRFNGHGDEPVSRWEEVEGGWRRVSE